MSILEPPTPSTDLDELSRLELSIAQRTDELLRQDAGRHPDRNFWQEAEREIWPARLSTVEPALAD
jgi:hypothetical protein